MDDAAAPVIKKRGGKRTGIVRRTSASPAVDSPAPADNEAEDSESNVDDLLALRAYRQAQRKAGIDVDRLHAGDEPKAKRPRRLSEEDAPLHLGLRVMKGETPFEKEEEPTPRSNIFKTTNFTGQTNALAVEKHMMAYIETELAKRKGGGQVDAMAELAKLDPHDELYRIAEKYQVDQRPVQEGNVTLSAAMLTAIPEVDLGIDNRLKNIEATEKAKRHLYEATQLASQRKAPEDGGVAAGRFFLADKQKQEVADIMALARAESEREERGEAAPKPTATAGQPGRPQRATDDAVMARFKQRDRERKSTGGRR